ncbi:uncharacterized protein F5891DRAFT_1278725 [Suillus fuscotomentosus]|uniref:DUF6533 domain-containing protein n=1 Tax=Suillus fuscotomentosus TaxID=1912939 RepID=A0AAD4HJ87_9AGAM|nr:uncharacterized protein F5891DRAFT_1278725 [Suillus fuscotomentosus]KAG1899655.1 hypothetical protein F5891DRAFT_1278725 [Suillus fuscotomentosus]
MVTETEHLTNAFAAGRSLQILAVRLFLVNTRIVDDKMKYMYHQYIYTSMATFWAYEYVCSLQQEWTFLHRSRWTKVKGLYILTRYVPFLLLTTNLYTCLVPYNNPGKCRTWVNICSGFSIILGICSQSFFILRTCALWNNNRILVVFMLLLSHHPSAFPLLLLPQHHVRAFIDTLLIITIHPTFTVATSHIPGITGCYQVMSSVSLFIPFLLYFALALGLMALTLIRAIKSWQTTNGHLYVVLLKHNISYYACGLLFSVTNIFTSLLLHYAYHAMLHDLQFIVLAILATSMHRHLWQMDLHTHVSDANVRFLLSEFSTADRMAEHFIPWGEL